jgi:hypothetical protein
MRNYLYRILMMGFFAGAICLSSCGDDDDASPSVAQISPVQGASNTVLTVTGAGLGDIKSIVFENSNVPASFTSTFNTDGAILFRVPTDAIPGEQNIVFTNGSGKQFTVPFNVLGFAAITSVSDYNFVEGTEITLTGKNLADVNKVVFTGTTEEVEIVSQTATTLTLKFPATALNEATLTITNEAGGARTTQSFVAIDNAFKLFTDNYGAGYENASWGPASISTETFKRGTASFSMGFNKGNWSQDGFGWTTTPNDNYKFMSFWMKGASQDYTLYVWSAAQPGTFNTYEDWKKILVPANVWTYYKIPVSTLKIWGENGTGAWNQIGWRIQGPDAQDETFYVDDVIFIK